MTLKQWRKSPKGYVVIAMIAYLIIASIGSHSMMGMVNGSIAVGACLIIDIVCALIAKKKRIMPDGAVITGLIIALILSATTHWSIVVITAVISILSKYLLVHKKKPIFNPAVFGLLLSILIFGVGQSWWGSFGDLPAWMIIFLVIGGYKVMDRVNKYAQVFSFLGASFILLFLMGHFNIGDASDALRPPFINATLFFGFFMLTDPPTSPAKAKDQVVFGMLTALVGTVIYGFFGGLTYLFIGLLMGNLYHLLRQAHLNKKQLRH
jgi:Na+-translocating ferredoxin:NAD+ oxidoreductase RnfD subunit